MTPTSPTGRSAFSRWPTPSEGLLEPTFVPPESVALGRGRRTRVPLGNGEVGYCMRRYEDCLRPAVATVLQVPVEQVPDARICDRLLEGDSPEAIVRESWATLEAWLAERGLRLVFHDTPPNRGRWIGVCRLEGRSASFDDHCVVMRDDRVHFDPAIGLPAPHGQRLRTYSPAEIVYGISFDRTE